MLTTGWGRFIIAYLIILLLSYYLNIYNYLFIIYRITSTAYWCILSERWWDHWRLHRSRRRVRQSGRVPPQHRRVLRTTTTDAGWCRQQLKTNSESSAAHSAGEKSTACTEHKRTKYCLCVKLHLRDKRDKNKNTNGHVSVRLLCLSFCIFVS